MQFIANGPDIPETLLQAHEEGRVVFFCGAGISYPAGLPGFSGLVEDIYRLVGTSKKSSEQAAFDRKQYDATLDLLERRIPGQRLEVRRALAKALRPKYRRKGATDTHSALLYLSRCRQGEIRLVTTNFDRVFEQAAKKSKQAFDAYKAPMLPIPKKSRWNGVVYLHGQLPSESDDTALQRLVLSSGDFGLAYLTERWAARFVSELFRNFIVVFIGYSIDDPVLRYMMDALAADRMLGEHTPEAYALGDCAPRQHAEKTDEWKAKGVSPILYEVVPGSKDHSALHETIQRWAETYRDGVMGKERIVVANALARPSASTAQDNFVGRMLWALADESGLPAKALADHDPAPQLDWLDALSKPRYSVTDLTLFGITPRGAPDKSLKFSLIWRPAPYIHAPWMSLSPVRQTAAQWDAVLTQIARWLMRHLNSPKLIIWLTRDGGRLTEQMAWMVNRELGRFSGLRRDGKIAEIAEIRAKAPDAIPDEPMQKLWRLLLADRIKAQTENPDIYDWIERLKNDGLTSAIRFELRGMIAPKVLLRESYRYGEMAQRAEPKDISDVVQSEIVLATQHAESALSPLIEGDLRRHLPQFFNDFQSLLRDAMDLMYELGDATDVSDRSWHHLPSISPHKQNNGFHEWVLLVELVRDSWLGLLEVDQPRATRAAKEWFDQPFPVFRRLALFAASQTDDIEQATWVSWLVSNDGWWLWATETFREAMRLLVLRGETLDPQHGLILERAIVIGPPRAMYREDLAVEEWEDAKTRAIWLRLEKLQASGYPLGKEAADRLEALRRTFPQWRLSADESDEFVIWMGGNDDEKVDDPIVIDPSSIRKGDVIKLLKRKSDPQANRGDFWHEICRISLAKSLSGLRALASEGDWPVDRWRTALQVWREDKRVVRSWRYAAPILREMPEIVFIEVLSSFMSWLVEATKKTRLHEGILLEICRRVLAVPFDADTGILVNGEPIQQPVTEAINHPVGQVVQVLVAAWFERKPNDNERLPDDLRPIFTEICDAAVLRFRHGRVILAANLIALFRVDRSWCEAHFLHYFDWEEDLPEAKAVWEGFLWSPRLYRPLLMALKDKLLATPLHYEDLGEHKRQFAIFLTYVALDSPAGYSAKEFAAAFSAFTGTALNDVAQGLVQALEGAGERREEYWQTRIAPFWRVIWPKDLALVSPKVSELLARLSIAAGEEFPAAEAVVHDWLRPLEFPYHIHSTLKNAGHCNQFPSAALRLIAAIYDEQSRIHGTHLTEFLAAIGAAKPELQHSVEYQRLSELARRRGR